MCWTHIKELACKNGTEVQSELFEQALLFIQMKLIKLTQGYFVKVSDDDYDWLNQWKWKVLIDKNRKAIYAARSTGTANKRGCELMHRLILGITDRWQFGDHINGDGLDNQRENLRVATNSQNQANRSGVVKNKTSSQYLGVSNSVHGLWLSRCQKDNKVYHKAFKTEKEAALWYNEKAKELHGKFAKLNIIK